MPIASNGDLNIATDNNEANYELESQFILRLPPGPAAGLRAVVGSGVLNLKDRLTIQIDTDMRHGTVNFDDQQFSARIVDLPCVIETLKTLDGKLFYKTADVCQMMICKEENKTDDEDRAADSFDDSKRKDGKDKKYLWMHGITPPLKNVRKKRFRKTLKKKFVDVPEIEKEVKRLFKTDSEAISIRYEVVEAEDERLDSKNPNSNSAGASGLIGNSNSQSQDISIDQHDLFGEVLSSSDEDDTRAQDTDDNSVMSSCNLPSTSGASKKQNEKYITEFSKEMLEEAGSKATTSQPQSTSAFDMTESSTDAAAAVAALEADDNMNTNMNVAGANESYINQLRELEREITSIQQKREAQEAEIERIDNPALVQRFHSIIENLKKEEASKRQKYEEILNLSFLNP